jgi:hypothetical protein
VRDAVVQAGLVLEDECVRFGIDPASAAKMMRELLALPQRPVVAINDVFAVGAMTECREQGVRIPEEISITGVDNTDLGATQTAALTSIRTPIVETARAAAEQLIARLEGREFLAFQTLGFELALSGQYGGALGAGRIDIARGFPERGHAPLPLGLGLSGKLSRLNGGIGQLSSFVFSVRPRAAKASTIAKMSASPNDEMARSSPFDFWISCPT